MCDYCYLRSLNEIPLQEEINRIIGDNIYKQTSLYYKSGGLMYEK